MRLAFTPQLLLPSLLVLSSSLPLLSCIGGAAEGIDRIDHDAVLTDIIPVETLLLESQSFEERFDAAGIIEAEEEITVSAEIAGRILAVHREIGDRVGRGQLLISLDDRAIRAQVQKFRAQLDRAQTQLAWARRDLERQTRLFEDQVAAERALDEAHRLVDTSEDDVAAQEAELEIADVDLERSQISSPIAGLVARRYVSIGEYMTPGTRLFDLVAIDVVKFTFSVAERDITGIRDGQVIPIRVDAYSGTTFEASVRAVSPAGSDRTRTFRVELELRNPEASPLRPGMSGRATMVRAQFDRVFLIPEAAILREGASSYVYVTEEDVARRRDVEIVSQSGSLAVVSAAAGDRMECIILGQAAVADGTAIRVRRVHDEPPRLVFD